MGFKDAEWAYSLDLPATSKAVLVALCHRSNDKTHTTLIGQQAVAEMLGLTSRAVMKAMKALEELGVIRRERRYLDGGFRTSDRTIINRAYANEVRVTQANDVPVSHPNQSHVNEDHVNEDHVNDVPFLPEPRSGQRELRSLGQPEGQSDSSSEAAIAPIRHDVNRILDLLDSEIERNGSKRPTRTKANVDAARLLIDKDGRTVDQIERAIRWCQADEFWRVNILSMSKLREKYDQLRLAAQRTRSPVPLTRTEQNMAVVARIAAAEEAEQRGIAAS